MFVGLFVSACSPVIEESIVLEEPEAFEVGSEEETGEMVTDSNAEYEIGSVRLTPEEIAEAGMTGEYVYLYSLYYGETKLMDFPLEGYFGWTEFGIFEVFKGEEEDSVLVGVGAGCDDCVRFLEQYYVVNKTDLSIEEVPFAAPTGLSFERGDPIEVVMTTDAKGSNQMAYVAAYGSFEDPASYYEEVWVYLFNTREWDLAETTEKGSTVLCTMFNSLDFIDSTNIHFWKDALIISPDPIEGEMACELW